MCSLPREAGVDPGGHRGRPYTTAIPVAVCGCLLVFSLAQVAVYIADARAESLDLVSFSSEGAVHDWNFILGQWRMLRQDVAIGRFVKDVGWLILAGSVVLGIDAMRRSWTGTERALVA
jgi:hypothetical protein